MAVCIDELKAGDPRVVDKRVLDAFNAMEHSPDPAAARVAELKAKYEFVRPHLLDKRLKLVPGVAAYYLGQIGNTLGHETPKMN